MLQPHPMKTFRLTLGVAVFPFALSAQTTLEDPFEMADNEYYLFADAGEENAVIVTGPISGYGGRIIKDGEGTVTLLGENTSEASNFSLQAGTLVIGASNAFGSPEYVEMANGARLRFSADVTSSAVVVNEFLNIEVDPSVTVTLSGDTGGVLNKTGSGTLIIPSIAGDGRFASGSVIASGTLQLWAGDLFAEEVTVSAGATLRYTSGFGAPEHTVIQGEGSVLIAMTGGGSISLYAENTYTGGTTVTSGTLYLRSDNRLADTGALIMNGGTFNSRGFDETLGTLSVTADSFLDFGAGTSDLVFADSSALTWLGTLTLLNFTVGSDTLRIGTDSNGLTFEQLGQLNFGDGLWAHIDSLGFITPSTEPPASAIPEPGTCAALAGVFALAGALFRRRKRVSD